MFSFLFCGIFRETKRVSCTVPVSVDVVGNPRRQRWLECVLGSVLVTPLKQSIWWNTVVKTTFYLCIRHYTIRYVNLKYSFFLLGSEACWAISVLVIFCYMMLSSFNRSFVSILILRWLSLDACLFSCQPADKSNLGSLLWFHLSLSSQRGFLCQYTSKLS